MAMCIVHTARSLGNAQIGGQVSAFSDIGRTVNE